MLTLLAPRDKKRHRNPSPSSTFARLTENRRRSANRNVARLLEHDRADCEQIVRDNSDRLLAVARRVLKHEEDAADAVQDAFSAAFSSLGGFRAQSQISTWLYRIVLNVCLMRLRSKKRRQTVSLDSCQDPAMGSTPESDQLIRSEIRSKVRESIESLPDDYRAIILLRDIEQIDTDSTATILGLSRSATKTRLHRARRALKAVLQAEHANEIPA
jgi:RNA polymerase sigma-70 factor (ECF subfamily)